MLKRLWCLYYEFALSWSAATFCILQQADYRLLQQQLVAANRDLQLVKRDADAVMRASRTAKTHQMRSQHTIQTLQVLQR